MDYGCSISVIIPVYNVECYLSECVESVLVQSYGNIEVILVDDGSPDNCGMLCDDFARKDPRVRVIHKDNGGLSDARNVGLAAAVGEYVLFLDGDDYWDDKDALQRLIERIAVTGADVLNFSYKKRYVDTGKTERYFENIPPMPEGLSLRDQLDWLTEKGLYIASSCVKLARRSLLEGLEFPSGVYSEDIPWSAELLLNAKSMDFVCENFYCYRQRSGSITKNLKDKRCEDLASAILACVEMTNAVDEVHKDALLRYTAFQLGTFVLNQARAENKQTNAIHRLREHAGMLRYHGRNIKLLWLYWGSKLLGFEGLCTVARTVFG